MSAWLILLFQSKTQPERVKSGIFFGYIKLPFAEIALQINLEIAQNEQLINFHADDIIFFKTELK